MTVHLYVSGYILSHAAAHVIALVMAMLFLLRFDGEQSLFSRAPERSHDPICDEIASPPRICCGNEL